MSEPLIAILRRAPLLMEGLRAARDIDAPDWLIAAGAIRDLVWDELHGRPLTTPPRDLDLGFFDPDQLTPERDAEVEAALRQRAPDLPWDAKNQAAVHLWYRGRFGIEVGPFRCTAEAVATFPETASCIGVRLRDDDAIEVVAPHGLDDLFACVCRHNPIRVPTAYCARRVAEKGWQERWPKLRYAAMETPEESGAGYPEEQPSEVDDTPGRRDPEQDPSGGEGDKAPDNEDGTATGNP